MFTWIRRSTLCGSVIYVLCLVITGCGGSGGFTPRSPKPKLVEMRREVFPPHVRVTVKITAEDAGGIIKFDTTLRHTKTGRIWVIPVEVYCDRGEMISVPITYKDVAESVNSELDSNCTFAAEP